MKACDICDDKKPNSENQLYYFHVKLLKAGTCRFYLDFDAHNDCGIDVVEHIRTSISKKFPTIKIVS